MRALARLLVHHPLVVLFGVLGVSVVAVGQLVDLRTGEILFYVDPSVDRLMPDSGPERELYDDVSRRFGSDDVLTFAVVAEDVFTADVLTRIQRITERFQEVAAVRQVISLSTALNIRDEEGELSVEPFFTGLPEDPAQFEIMRRNALENPIYAGNLVSLDGTATAIVVQVYPMSEREFSQAGIDLQLIRIAEEERGEAEVWVTGMPRIKAETSRTLLADLAFVIPAAYLVACLVALLSFRTPRGGLVPATTVALALLWTVGLMTALERPINLVTVIVPPLLLAVGVAYTVHVVSGYYDALRAGHDDEGEGPVFEALVEVGLPVFLTALTTCVGFLSLTVSSIGAIREFGVFATVGVGFTVLLSLTWAPALLQSLPRPRQVAAPTQGALERGFTSLARFDVRQRNTVLACGAGVALLSVYGVTRIQVSTDLISNFPADSEVRTHFDSISEALGGANPFYVTIQADDRNAFKQPRNLQQIEALQRWLLEQPEVGSATSLVDHLKVLNWGFHENDPEMRAIPDSAALADQLLFFGANEEVERFANARYDFTRLQVRANVMSSNAMRVLLDRVRDRLGELPDHLRGDLTGNSVLVAKTVDDIAAGQVESLAIAFAVIYVILALLFTSARIGLIALIPNALPVLIYFGAMGLSGVTLNAVTSLVACIVLGIAVDDSIHYLARFNSAARETGSEEQGTVAALLSVGRPVTYTSIALCLGFLTLAFTNLRNQIEFGWLGSFTLFTAWAIDVTLTPALCSRLKIVSLWDALTLDLGKDPQHSIPIFAGLRRAQARVVALMMDLRSLPKGSELFRFGEHGDEMYVVIDGELVASIERDETRQEFGRMHRGDVVGEIALFHGERTADVDVSQDARLLKLTPAHLERLRRRYPRTAAIVFRNLSRILAGRVASTTSALR